MPVLDNDECFDDDVARRRGGNGERAGITFFMIPITKKNEKRQKESGQHADILNMARKKMRKRKGQKNSPAFLFEKVM
jgi:hypothetical protein